MAPPVLKLKYIAAFTATIESAGPISATRSGTVWTIQLDLSGLQAGVSDADVLYLGYDQSEAVWKTYNGVAVLSPPVREVTEAGDVTVTADDGQILINKTVPAATTVHLPAADGASPITIKDIAGNAETYNITIDPDGSETVDGQSTFVIASNYQAATFRPLPDGSGWYIT